MNFAKKREFDNKSNYFTGLVDIAKNFNKIK